jgi:two-component system phosphate regulon response regulator PhoB
MITYNSSPILVVDDDPDFCDIYMRILEKHGYRVLCFSNAGEALKKMIEEKPCLVITDLMMNSLDSGFSLAHTMREDMRLKNIPIIIVTAIGEKRGLDFTPRSNEDLKAMCADAFLEKPVLPHTLLATVEDLLCRTTEEAAE